MQGGEREVILYMDFPLVVAVFICPVPVMNNERSCEKSPMSLCEYHCSRFIIYITTFWHSMNFVSFFVN